MGIKVFFLEPTERRRQALRRFTYSNESSCPAHPKWGHDAETPIEDAPVVTNEKGYETDPPLPPKDDPRWPKRCACGYEFQDGDQWQVFANRIYTRLDTGEETTIRDAPVGAMWYAPWMKSYAVGPDGNSLAVKTPGGDWLVDSRASNCTKPDDKEHKCWVRHGDPKTGQVHVDKNGNTCAAGAGSIMINGYHGFLHNGELVSC